MDRCRWFRGAAPGSPQGLLRSPRHPRGPVTPIYSPRLPRRLYVRRSVPRRNGRRPARLLQRMTSSESAPASDRLVLSLAELLGDCRGALVNGHGHSAQEELREHGAAVVDPDPRRPRRIPTRPSTTARFVGPRPAEGGDQRVNEFIAEHAAEQQQVSSSTSIATRLPVHRGRIGIHGTLRRRTRGDAPRRFEQAT